MALAIALALTARAGAQWTATIISDANFGVELAAVRPGRLLGNTLGGDYLHACTWTGQSYTFTALHSGTYWSQATGLDGSTQVGMVYLSNRLWHACIWSGTAQSRVDINPPQSLQSYCLAADAGHQVGSAMVGGFDGACVWSGSASSWVPISPTGAASSRATSIEGTQIGGYGIFDNNQYRAGMWTGFDAANWIDLHPAGSSLSVCLGVSAGQQVGYAKIGTTSVASLWTGSAGSWTSLRPTGAGSSKAYAVHAGHQAGTVYFSGRDRAAVWSGSAASWEDLSAYISSEDYESSEARAVWSDSTTLYVAGFAFNTNTVMNVGVLWTRPLCCRADFDCSGALSVQDIFAYLGAWFAGDPAADLTGNGLSVQDIFDFLALWFAGC